MRISEALRVVNPLFCWKIISYNCDKIDSLFISILNLLDISAIFRRKKK